jgi:cytochrome c-type biogenesis protein CcmE
VTDDPQRIGSSDDAEADIDLSPRATSPVPSRKRRPWGAIAVLVVVVGDAGRRLRVQGVVDAGSVADDGTVTVFDVSFNGETIPVRYEGDPGGIFKECIPVVVHGVLKDGTFLGDRIEVKHSNEYEAENPDRVNESEDGECSQSA